MSLSRCSKGGLLKVEREELGISDVGPGRSTQGSGLPPGAKDINVAVAQTSGAAADAMAPQNRSDPANLQSHAAAGSASAKSQGVS